MKRSSSRIEMLYGTHFNSNQFTIVKIYRNTISQHREFNKASCVAFLHKQNSNNNDSRTLDKSFSIYNILRC